MTLAIPEVGFRTQQEVMPRCSSKGNFSEMKRVKSENRGYAQQDSNIQRDDHKANALRLYHL